MQNIFLLGTSTLSISILHTLTGPDHYLPFIVLSKSKRWSLQTTLFWTFICGIGHLASSVVLGLLGAWLGWTMSTLLHIESNRGTWVAWIFIVIGVAYTIWGYWKINRVHQHFHIQDNEVYVHQHQNQKGKKTTLWVLFIVFVLGPCEPLIPLLFSTANEQSISTLLFVLVCFSIGTLVSMLLMVVAGFYGLGWMKKTNALEKYIHCIAGITILISGLGMLLLEW